MRTRTLIPVIATALVCAVVFGVLNVVAQNVPDTITTPERCTPPKAPRGEIRQTIASNSEARVWLKETTRGNTIVRKFYACANHSRRHVYLASSKHDDLVDEGDTPAFSRVLVGDDSVDSTAVAFVKQTCPAGEDPVCDYTLRWVRLRDRKVLREYNTRGAERPTNQVIEGEALLFWVIDTDNSTGTGCGAIPCEIRMAGLQGDRTLDSGQRLGRLSKFAATAIYWEKDGNARGYDWGDRRMLE